LAGEESGNPSITNWAETGYLVGQFVLRFSLAASELTDGVGREAVRQSSRGRNAFMKRLIMLAALVVAALSFATVAAAANYELFGDATLVTGNASATGW